MLATQFREPCRQVTGPAHSRSWSEHLRTEYWSSFDRLVTPPDSSAAEEIAGRLPGARVVKAFNTTFAGTLVEGEVDGKPLDVLLAGDDDGAKAEVASLVEAGGMRAVDAGPLRRARQLEHLGFLHMALQDTLGAGFGSAVKFVTP